MPEALGQVYLATAHDRVPSSRWSLSNRFLAAIHGHLYAATYRQWQELGRQVQRGERSFSIIVPITRKATEDDPERGIEEGDQIIRGFSTCPVFGYDQTQGEPLEELEKNRELIDALPLVEVARAWDLEVTPFSGRDSRALGLYTGSHIGLGVENLSTWAHELVHAADDRLGNLERGSGPQLGRLDNEIVAEFGGAVLLEVVGYPGDSNRGGAYEYICRHAETQDIEPTRVISQLLQRIFACLDLILDTAEKIGALGGGNADGDDPVEELPTRTRERVEPQAA